jgi:hypothetical protein
LKTPTFIFLIYQIKKQGSKTMRKINIIAIMLMLISLSFADDWYATTLNCNDYQYFAPTKYKSIQIYSSSGALYPDASWFINCQTSPNIPHCDGIRVNNLGALEYHYDTSWLSAYLTLSPCTLGNCNYAFSFGYGVWNSSLTNFPVYSGCEEPTLTIENAYPSSIMSDRYRFNFTITNIDGYTGITCKLDLNGSPSKSSTTFTTSSVVDVLFSNFPRQTTIAHLVCTYLNAYGATLQFFNREWVVDLDIPYHITNLQREIGKVTTQPRYLYPYSNLTTIDFHVLSDFDKTNYGKPITATISSTDNLTALGCSGSMNKTMNIELYSSWLYYSLLLPVYCTSPITLNATLSVSDRDTLETLDTIPISISWVGGSMIIDNVNLIKNPYNAYNLELWATISNEYSHNPIPLEANLVCNYTATLQSLVDSDVMNGSMDVYKTYSGGLLQQTDARNNSMVNNTPEYIGRLFDIQIDCTANNYTSKSVYATRSMGQIRLASFVCIPMDVVYHSDPYTTDPTTIFCNAKPDLPISLSDFGANANFWVYQNVNNIGEFWGLCQENKKMNRFMPNAPNQAKYMAIVNFVSKDATCSYQHLPDGKVSNALIEFNYPRNSSYFDYYTNSTLVIDYGLTPTTAYLTFDLAYHPLATIGSTQLQLLKSNTNTYGLVEDNSSIVCSTTYFDNYSTVQNIEHIIYDVGTGDTCSANPTIKKTNGNGSYSYVTIITSVNQKSCWEFWKIGASGTLQCKATVYQVGSAPTYYYSNTLAYKAPSTSASSNTKREIGAYLGSFWNEWGAPILDYIFKFFKSNPLLFAFIIFMFVVILIPILYLIIRLKTGRGG